MSLCVQPSPFLFFTSSLSFYFISFSFFFFSYSCSYSLLSPFSSATPSLLFSMSHIIDPSHRNPPANRRTVGDQFSTAQPSVAQHLGHQTKPTKSKINTKSPDYIANYKEMLEMVDQLNERLQEATFQGADRLLALHHKRGSILGTPSCFSALLLLPIRSIHVY